MRLPLAENWREFWCKKILLSCSGQGRQRGCWWWRRPGAAQPAHWAPALPSPDLALPRSGTSSCAAFLSRVFPRLTISAYLKYAVAERPCASRGASALGHSGSVLSVAEMSGTSCDQQPLASSYTGHPCSPLMPKPWELRLVHKFTNTKLHPQFGED